MFERIKKAVRHNQGLTTALVVVAVLVVWLIGCESSVRSPFEPARRVTRPQLVLEWERYAGEVELAIADLDRQDLFKTKLFEIGVLVAQGGTVNPLGAGVTLLGILGIGAAVDNKKKDSIIKTLQNGNTNTKA